MIPRSQHNKLCQSLSCAIDSLVGRGMAVFLCGGALGFDTLAARCVIEAQKQYPHILLRLILPCKTQAKAWTENAKREYEAMLGAADSVEYISEEYISGCMQARNRRLVELSSVCVCYKTRASGGTAYTVARAEEKGIEIINLADRI
ncbi:MAG: DUF1273 family protein [Eubacteriales bacterium]|nr:DUF1273 family protein [Eubacteriales bacterium]